MGVWVVSSLDTCLKLVNKICSESFGEKVVHLKESLVLE